MSMPVLLRCTIAWAT